MPRLRSTRIVLRLLFLAVLLGGAPAPAAPLTPGNLVALRIGNGSVSLNSTAHPASIDEYTPAGTLVQSIDVTAATGATLSGTATMEGALSFSRDGRYLVFVGYGCTVGTASPGATTALPRRVCRMALDGTLEYSDFTAQFFSTRSVASTDGNQCWIVTQGGVWFAPWGGAPTQLVSMTLRVAGIFRGQLYVSASTTFNSGVDAVGTGLPQSGTPYLRPLLPSTTQDDAGFWFKDPSTLYVAKDTTITAPQANITKWTCSGGIWTNQTIAFATTTGGIPVRGLAGTIDSTGNAVLYGANATGKALIRAVDDNFAPSAAPLANAPMNCVYRGVAVVPTVPPLSIAPTGTGVTLTWPTTEGWFLEENSELARPAGWTEYTPTTSSAGTSRADVPGPLLSRDFFRLHHE